MSGESQTLGPRQKALKINLAPNIYGSFAEIGAGQEVARFFFQAGAASGTVAQTISAYDMTFSDALYGKAKRYVCYDRLIQMLTSEYNTLESRLRDKHGKEKQYFAFANTVAAKKFNQDSECHGWLGVRFQHEQGAAPSDIVIHIRMLDEDNLAQQQAIGVVGVNLVYAAFHHTDNLAQFVASLVDRVGSHRIEVDMIRVSGPSFEGVDNRLLSLQLVKTNMTHAVLFNPKGEVVQPSDELYRKNILLLRGSFRPPTHVNMDMLKTGLEKIEAEIDDDSKVAVLTQVTIQNLKSTAPEGEIDDTDFLARVDLLGALGQNVLVSNYSDYYRLNNYFSRFKCPKLRFVMGIYNLITLFEEKSYDNLEGGILEGFGRLFQRDVKLYVYPYKEDDGNVLNVDNFPCPENLKHLYAHLKDSDHIWPITNHDETKFNIWSRVVLKMIQEGKDGWESMVPDLVVEKVKEDCLFGYPCDPKKGNKK